MILRRADEIAASGTTPPACSILSLFLEQILLIQNTNTSCHRKCRLLPMDCCYSYDSFWKFQLKFVCGRSFAQMSRNRTITSAQILVWDVGEWMYLEGGCSNLYSYSNFTVQQPKLGGGDEYLLQVSDLKWNLKNIQTLVHFGFTPLLFLY